MLSTKNNLPASGLLLRRKTTHDSDRLFHSFAVQCAFRRWEHTNLWGPLKKGGVVTVYVSSLSGDSWSTKWRCCRVIWSTSVSLITRHRVDPGTSLGGWSGTGSMWTINTCTTRTPNRSDIYIDIVLCWDQLVCQSSTNILYFWMDFHKMYYWHMWPSKNES